MVAGLPSLSLFQPGAVSAHQHQAEAEGVGASPCRASDWGQEGRATPLQDGSAS